MAARWASPCCSSSQWTTASVPTVQRHACAARLSAVGLRSRPQAATCAARLGRCRVLSGPFRALHPGSWPRPKVWDVAKRAQRAGRSAGGRWLCGRLPAQRGHRDWGGGGLQRPVPGADHRWVHDGCRVLRLRADVHWLLRVGAAGAAAGPRHACMLISWAASRAALWGCD